MEMNRMGNSPGGTRTRKIPDPESGALPDFATGLMKRYPGRDSNPLMTGLKGQRLGHFVFRDDKDG